MNILIVLFVIIVLTKFGGQCGLDADVSYLLAILILLSAIG